MAYQGKFSQPRNTEENIRLRAEAQKKEAAEKKLPATAQAPVPKVPKAVDTAPVKKNGKRKKKKANRTVTLVFYTFYFVLVAAGLAGIFFLHSWLNNYLTKYEASSPPPSAPRSSGIPSAIPTGKLSMPKPALKTPNMKAAKPSPLTWMPSWKAKN